MMGSPPMPMQVDWPMPRRVKLIHGFVGERAAAADDADVAGLVNLSRHDADFAFAGRDDAGAVGADEARGAVAQHGGDAHHVERGNAFGDANDQRQPGVNAFEDGVGGVGRRNENNRGVGLRLTSGFGDGIEHRDIEMQRAAFAGRDAGDDLGAVGDHLLGVEGALAAGEALHDQREFFR